MSGNDLILKRMNVQVTCIFMQIVLQEDLFCHGGKSQLLFIHEMAQGVFDYRALKQAGFIHLKVALMSQRIGFVCWLDITDYLE